MPMHLYGFESWTLTKGETGRIETTEMRFLKVWQDTK
jgi:hypothetical protein